MNKKSFEEIKNEYLDHMKNNKKYNEKGIRYGRNTFEDMIVYLFMEMDKMVGAIKCEIDNKISKTLYKKIKKLNINNKSFFYNKLIIKIEALDVLFNKKMYVLCNKMHEKYSSIEDGMQLELGTSSLLDNDKLEIYKNEYDDINDTLFDEQIIFLNNSKKLKKEINDTIENINNQIHRYNLHTIISKDEVFITVVNERFENLYTILNKISNKMDKLIIKLDYKL